MADNTEKRAEESLPTTEPVTQPSGAKPAPAGQDDESDPDFDDLDDVLDQFSANASNTTDRIKSSTSEEPSQPIPNASGPGRPSSSSVATDGHNDIPLPPGPQPNESESDFIARLSKEMSTMLDSFSADPSNSNQSPEDIAKMGKELEDFTRKMEDEGIQPEDLLKALLGQEEGGKLADLAHAERDKLDTTQPSSSSTVPPLPPLSPTKDSKSPERIPLSGSVPQSPTSATKPSGKSFEDTIRSTMSRLGESDKSATTAAQQQSSKKSEEDLLADMLRALESSGGGSGSGTDEDGLSKMFLDMMQQLTHKDLLYEPMKELNDQYPAWLQKNKSSISTADYERYTRQSAIVADITRKFEEPGFNDNDPKCRDFIWDRMQKMQEEGAPPEELVKSPLPGTDLGGGGGGIPGLGGGAGAGGEIPEELSKELEEGCPTQ